MDSNLLSSFYAFSAGALYLLGFLFLLNVNQVNVQGSIKGNQWLGVFYLILACAFTQLFYERFTLDAALVTHLLELPRWAMLPCFYMAVRQFVSPTPLKKYQYLHFAPFLLFLLFSLVFLLPALFNVQTRLPELPAWVPFIVRYFFFGQALFYWITCFVLVRRHTKNIKEVSSFTERIDLGWVRYLLGAMLFLILIRAFTLFVPAIGHFSPALYFAGVVWLAYLTLTQKSIYTTETYPSAEPVETVSKKVVYERLTSGQVDELKNIILEKVTAGQLHLDPGLTLSILSEKTGISPHELSYVLNNGWGKNFYQFINELRTEEAKSLLLSHEAARLDMLGIATRAGFNSKTTFYKTFRNSTGMTPKEYLKTNPEVDSRATVAKF